jgi:transcriptional regulator with XRE-family HTH domain
MTLSDSIKRIRKALGLTQEQFAFELGVKRSLIGAYEEGRAEPRLDLLHSMARLGNVSLEYFISGGRGSNDLVGDTKSHQDNIQLVPVKAAAGYMRGYSDEAIVSQLPRFSLPMLKGGDYRAFEINGDSMLPLVSGTVVVGEQLDNLEDIKDGKTYILVTKEEGIVYKRVFNRIKENGTLTLASDNPIYKTYFIDSREVLEVWGVKAFISVDVP